MNRSLHILLGFILLAFLPTVALQSQDSTAQAVAQGQLRSSQQEDLRAWLENMVWHHQFTLDEIEAVTGLGSGAIETHLDEFGIRRDNKPARDPERMLLLPYPGGRHPRIGFLDGAVKPQRETKLSAFCPWDETSYAVIDVPEAIWSNLGLTYLAHTHVETVWTKAGVELEQLEWERQGEAYQLVRRLPNGIEFGVKAIPLKDHVRMKMWLTNNTEATLTDLRVQNCVMLKGAPEFADLTNDNKLFHDGYASVHNSTKDRWVITAWDPVHRPWGNARCPCLHSDPKFEDCPPGETRWLRGWFSFYEGTDIQSELARIEATAWREHPLHHVTGNLIGNVVEDETGKVLPSRLYVQNVDTGEFHFATSTAVAGDSVRYDKQSRNPASFEKHTSLSAHGFQVNVPPGSYRLTAFHGKEFLSDSQTVEVTEDRVSVRLALKRFVDMPSQGWYSGDTHVHRTMDEVPTSQLAEDLNVTFPLNYWVRDSRELPFESGPVYPPQTIPLDATHVIYPVNTEYEIFSVDGKRHTQGAVFVLNHRTPLAVPAPPVAGVTSVAREQGGLLDLDKHSWNWSVMIVPLMQVDLFELSNNHHWKTAFGFPQWTLENAPKSWSGIERDEAGFTEVGWTQFGFKTYYAFLNCGFRMRVSGGTASGVHPVPIGYGRVYAHIDSEFSYEAWVESLDQGKSFVTQGPLMNVRFNEELPGTTWKSDESENKINITGTIDATTPLTQIEVVRNGEVVLRVDPQLELTSSGSYRAHIDLDVDVSGSGWVALRCNQQPPPAAPAGKVIFAHTNPVFLDVAGQPLKPKREELEYFINRLNEELQRNQGILSAEAMDEINQARQVYEKLLEGAD